MATRFVGANVCQSEYTMKIGQDFLGTQYGTAIKYSSFIKNIHLLSKPDLYCTEKGRGGPERASSERDPLRNTDSLRIQGEHLIIIVSYVFST